VEIPECLGLGVSKEPDGFGFRLQAGLSQQKCNKISENNVSHLLKLD